MRAQLNQYFLDSITNETTVTFIPDVPFLVLNDGGFNNSYTGGHDWIFIIQGTCNNPYKLFIEFYKFDINTTDTFYIYDGASTVDRLIIKGNNIFNNMYNRIFYIGSTNTSNSITIRLKSIASEDKGEGFSFRVKCEEVCEYRMPQIDFVYYCTRDGEIYDSCVLRKFILLN